MSSYNLQIIDKFTKNLIRINENFSRTTSVTSDNIDFIKLGIYKVKIIT